MRKDVKPYHILIIEDNLGDFVLIEEYLSESILDATLQRADNFQQAKELIRTTSQPYDIILLDISLPDLSGEELIVQIIDIAHGCPVVALTGFSDLDFSIRSLSLGISDYLLKDDLTSTTLYKSIIYSIQRSKFIDQIQKSEKRYSNLFHLSPLPMWVFDVETLRFLDVNRSAVQHYGYSEEEFYAMKITDIRPPEDIDHLKTLLKKAMEGKAINPKNVFRHLKKSGELIVVEATVSRLTFNERYAGLVLINDITDRNRYINTIEKQNQTLLEIAWIQSHVVRAPLARLMGLVDLMEMELKSPEEGITTLMNYIKDSAEELDQIIREITKKSDIIEGMDKHEF
jgi:PAS domain S-box-containing protein